MDYSLAKRLKEAGFPQRTVRGNKPDAAYMKYGYPMYMCEHGNSNCPDGATYYTCRKTAYMPPLAELIEACGRHYETLTRRVDEMYNTKEWGAWAFNKTSASTGPTPEIAVANLWLALNAKV